MKYIFGFMVVAAFCTGALHAQDITPVQIECAVLSPQGGPVAGAAVKVLLRHGYGHDAEKDEILASGSTDADGVFRVTVNGRPNDTMTFGTVIASKEGVGVGGEGSVYVRRAEGPGPVKVTVKLAPAAECRVRLMKPDGSPAAGVKLRVDQCTMPRDSRGFMFDISYSLPDLPEIGWHGVTDAEGRCVIANLPREAFLYLRHDAADLAQLPGLYMGQHKDALRALDQENERRLVPAGSVRGRITLPDGTPVKGGAVSMLEEHPYSTAYGEQLCVDAEGRFEFRQVPPSKYKISYRALKQDEARWIGDTLPQQVVKAGKTTEVGDLKLSRTAIVTARVLDAETGKEIEEPILFHLKEGSHQLRYRSKRSGPATHLPPEPNDFIPVQVTAGERKSIEFRLKPMNADDVAQGTVLDESGKPVAGASVQLLGDHSGFQVPRACDAKGAFRFVLQGAKTGLAVLAWDEKGISEPVALKAGGTVTVTLQSTGLASIHGVIRDEQGRPVHGATFQLLCDNIDSIHGGPISGSRQVEADGRFAVPMMPRAVKEVTLFAYADGYAAAALRDQAVKPGETFEWNPVLKTTREFVEGIVVDKQGAPVAGADIHIYGDEQPTNIKPVRTDAEGRFRVSHLAAGSLRVIVKQKTTAFSRDTWMDTKAPKSGLRLVMPDATGKASGIVLDHQGKPIAGAEVEAFVRGRKTHTDKAGRFALDGLELGWLTVDVRTTLPDGTKLEKDFRVKTGMQQIKLTLPATGDDASYNAAAVPMDLVGKPAPEIHVATWIHTEPMNAKAGGKVRILDFWGMECAPCLAGFPKVQKFWQEHQQAGIEILALGSGFYPEQEVQEYLQKHPDLRFPIAVSQADARDAEAYQVRGVPTYVVIGKDGRILSSGHDWNEAAAMALKAAKL